jgi:hypothetical protein
MLVEDLVDDNVSVLAHLELAPPLVGGTPKGLPQCLGWGCLRARGLDHWVPLASSTHVMPKVQQWPKNSWIPWNSHHPYPIRFREPSSRRVHGIWCSEAEVGLELEKPRGLHDVLEAHPEVID